MAGKVLSSILRDLKRRYLEEKARRGGYVEQFRNYVIADFRQRPARYPAEEMLKRAATSVWEKDQPPDRRQFDLFKVNGYALPNEFTVPDLSVPGGYRKVLKEFATIDQADKDADYKLLKAAEASEAALKDKRAVNAMKERADGDVSAAVANHIDNLDRKAA